MARVPAQRSDDLEQLWVDGRKHDERRGAVIVYELQRAFEVGVRARVKAVVRVCVEVVIALYRGQKVLLEPPQCRLGDCTCRRAETACDRSYWSSRPVCG